MLIAYLILIALAFFVEHVGYYFDLPLHVVERGMRLVFLEFLAAIVEFATNTFRFACTHR